jgi:hypothetical protein
MADDQRFLAAPKVPRSVAGESRALGKATSVPEDAPETATLVFDSAQVPLPAGVRGAFASARQLLYKSGSICIDLRLQPGPGSDSAVLIGQLLDSASAGHGMGDIPVSLVCEGGTPASNKTNNSGEFDFAFETPGRTQLIFGMGKRRTIVVPIPDSGIEMPSSTAG